MTNKISISVAALLGLHGLTLAGEKNQPNIIYIFTDQQHANMMSCAGNKWVKTPALDYIAQNGVRFTRAYACNPVSVPSRISMMTGRFAGEFKDVNGQQVRENDGGSFNFAPASITQEVQNSTLPVLLKQAGYDSYYGGKVHLPKPLLPQALGSEIMSNDERGGLADDAAKFLKQKHEKPFYLTLSFINPHDICYLALRDFTTSESEKKMISRSTKEVAALEKSLQIPEGVSEEDFYSKYCPTLPPNFEPQKDEPLAVKKLLELRDFRIGAREKYTEKQWRMHRWAYARLTEQADAQIQTILNALIETKQLENTVIIFSSDHGDMDASHRMEHKTALYEESAGVPFMVMWKGEIKGGQVDNTHLISNGLDLLPTVCDFAGFKAVADPRGKSVRPLCENKKSNWRKSLGVETEIGRMVVMEDKLKYIKYDAVGIEEQLIDLKTDPYEMTHVTNDKKYKSELKKARKEFNETWFTGF
jgi:arylsulfatase A-like enzyme